MESSPLLLNMTLKYLVLALRKIGRSKQEIGMIVELALVEFDEFENE